MTEDEQLVQTTIRSSGATLCAVADGAFLYRLTDRGIGALVLTVQKERDAGHTPLDWGDKLVGRAAALLFTLVNPRSVFAATMSVDATDALRAAGIPFTYDVLIPCVLNSEETGMCPMEVAVSGVDDPLEALQTLERTVQAMSHTGRTDAPEKRAT